MTVTITLRRILLAVGLGTIVGPARVMAEGVSPSDLISGGYWWTLLAGSITSFAALVVASVTLLSALWNLPTLRKVPTDAENPPGA